MQNFEPIGLKALGSGGLMDRIETKYWFQQKDLIPVLSQLREEYFILEINAHRIQQYQSEYYDTEDLHFYHMHHNGRLNRLKLRTRFYPDSNVGFFEIKEKTNKFRTVKNRIPYNYAYGPITNQALDFIKERYAGNIRDLKDTVKVEYRRITLVKKDRTERITLDMDLTFYNTNTKVVIPELIIAEVKQNAKQFSTFFDLMKKIKVQTDTLSKYCLAIALTQTQIKTNRFKPQLLKLKDYDPSNTLRRFY